MQKISLGPCITFFPQPLTWVVSVDADGAIDIMTASWVNLVSKTPPTLGVALHHQRKTLANIVASRCFSVNVVPGSERVAGDYCGLVSGHQTDKLTVSGLTAVAGHCTAAPLIAEAPLNLECTLDRIVEIGDYRLVLGSICEVHIAAAAQRSDGSFDAAVCDPLVYLGGLREYWALGAQAGTAYSDGKELLNT